METVPYTIQAYKEVRSNMKIKVLFGSQGWLACYLQDVKAKVIKIV
jgi:hypothetical protein